MTSRTHAPRDTSYRPPNAHRASDRKPANQAQFDYIKGLIEKRDTSAIVAQIQHARELGTKGQLSSLGASDLIDLLKKQPFKAPRQSQPQDQLPDVPAGYYALRNVQPHQPISFFQIDRPTEGRYAGRTFVKHLQSDTRVRVTGSDMVNILKLIFADMRAAASLYGSKIGKCPRCHRKLTDDVSRTRGIGPDCEIYWGWPKR